MGYGHEMEQDGAHRVLSAATGKVPGGFRKKRKGGKKKGRIWP